MALDLDRLLQEGQARGKAEQMAQQLAYLVMCQQAGLRLPNELIAMSIPQEIASAQPNLMLQGAAQSQAQMRSASPAQVHYPAYTQQPQALPAAPDYGLLSEADLHQLSALSAIAPQPVQEVQTVLQPTVMQQGVPFDPTVRTIQQVQSGWAARSLPKVLGLVGNAAMPLVFTVLPIAGLMLGVHLAYPALMPSLLGKLQHKEAIAPAAAPSAKPVHSPQTQDLVPKDNLNSRIVEMLKQPVAQ